MKQRQKRQSFHNFYHNLIKEKTGATYVSWEVNPEGYFLKVIINGGAIYCEVGGSPNDVTAEAYLSLLNELENGIRKI